MNLHAFERLPASQADSDGLQLIQFLPKPDSRGVEAPLDRSHRAAESIAHLNQRLAFEIEGEQRASIEVSQSLQATPQLILSFAGHQFVERGTRIRIH